MYLLVVRSSVLVLLRACLVMAPSRLAHTSYGRKHPPFIPSNELIRQTYAKGSPFIVTRTAGLKGRSQADSGSS